MEGEATSKTEERKPKAERSYRVPWAELFLKMCAIGELDCPKIDGSEESIIAFASTSSAAASASGGAAGASARRTSTTIDEASLDGSRHQVEGLEVREHALKLIELGRSLELVHSLRLLAAGEAVTTVVGYESLSAFVSAFRRTFGTTPGHYFS